MLSYELLTTIIPRHWARRTNAVTIISANTSVLNQAVHLFLVDLDTSVGTNLKNRGNDHALEVLFTGLANVVVFILTSNWNGSAGHTLQQVNGKLDISNLASLEDSRHNCLTNGFLLESAILFVNCIAN